MSLEAISQVLEDLARQGASSVSLTAGPFRAVVVPSRGAKVVAAGVGDSNFLWTPGGTERSEAVEDAWVAGGERSWLAPEGGENGLFYGNDVTAWSVPAALDPGNFAVAEAAEDSVRCVAAMALTDESGADLSLRLSRDVVAAWHTSPVECGSLSVTTTVRNEGASPLPPYWAPWAICQVPNRDRGALFSRVRGTRGTPFRTIFGADQSPATIVTEGAVIVPAEGGKKLKIGIDGTHSTGCNGHVLFDRDPLRWVIQRWEVHQSGRYVEEGDAAQLFNSPTSGSKGFSELEAHAAAVKLAPGASISLAVEYCFADVSSSTVAALAPMIGVDPDTIVSSVRSGTSGSFRAM